MQQRLPVSGPQYIFVLFTDMFDPDSGGNHHTPFEILDMAGAIPCRIMKKLSTMAFFGDLSGYFFGNFRD